MQEGGRHVPNLVVAETESDVVPPQVFEGDTCIKQFLAYLDTLAENCSLTVLAHNFQGYDSYPIVEEYHCQRRKVEQVQNGGKVLQLTLGKIRFIDSLSFFQMPLSAFLKTFGLTELKKGIFLSFFQHQGQSELRAPPLTQGHLFTRWHDGQGATRV